MIFFYVFFGRLFLGYQVKKERCRVFQRDLVGRELVYSVQVRCYFLFFGFGDLGFKVSSFFQVQLGCLIRYVRVFFGLSFGQNVFYLFYRVFCGCLSFRRFTIRFLYNLVNRFGRGFGVFRRLVDLGGRFFGGRRIEVRCQVSLGVYTGRRGCSQVFVFERVIFLGFELFKVVCIEGKRVRISFWRFRFSVGFWLQGVFGSGLCVRGQFFRCFQKGGSQY